MATAVHDRPVEAASTPDAGMEKLRDLLYLGDVKGARTFVKELATRWPDNEEIRQAAAVLELPRVTVGPATSRFKVEREWAWEHGRDYPGQWLAVKGDSLLAVAPTKEALCAQLDDLDMSEILIHYSPRVLTYPSVHGRSF